MTSEGDGGGGGAIGPKTRAQLLADRVVKHGFEVVNDVLLRGEAAAGAAGAVFTAGQQQQQGPRLLVRLTLDYNALCDVLENQTVYDATVAVIDEYESKVLPKKTLAAEVAAMEAELRRKKRALKDLDAAAAAAGAALLLSSPVAAPAAAPAPAAATLPSPRGGVARAPQPQPPPPLLLSKKRKASVPLKRSDAFATAAAAAAAAATEEKEEQEHQAATGAAHQLLRQKQQKQKHRTGDDDDDDDADADADEEEEEADEDEEDEEEDSRATRVPRRAGDDDTTTTPPPAHVFNANVFKYTTHAISKEHLLLAVARQVQGPGGFNMSALLKDLKLPVGAGSHLRTWYNFTTGKTLPTGVRGRKPALPRM